MQDKQQSHDERHLLLNMILIVLETVFSFILKNDSIIQLQAKKFIQNQITLKVSSYLPFFELYVQFTEKGLLFERLPPKAAIDLELGISVVELFKIFFFVHQPSVDTIHINGEETLADEFKGLLLYFSAPRLLSDWQQWFISREHSLPEDATSSAKRVAPLVVKIEQQRDEINQLKMELVQYKHRLLHSQQRQHSIAILFGSVCTLLILGLLYSAIR